MPADPAFRNARREGLIISLAWAASTVYCCFYSYFYGYIREGHDLAREDIRPVFGVPSWFWWGVIVPWGVCAAFTFWFAGKYMADDDLGADRAEELEEGIREGGTRE